MRRTPSLPTSPLSSSRPPARVVLRALAPLLLLCLGGPVQASDIDEERRDKLDAIAEHRETVMVPMRDGVRLASDIYTPKDSTGPLPTVFWRTPYNFHELRGTRLQFALASVERGYAFVIQNERGKFHSEGEWEILGFPRTDGYDALTWIADQEWSNGRIGTLGCSSSAEWQMALAAEDHPAHAAMVPMAAGAGIGRVGEFYEQGNWYRGGAEQMFYLTWLYGVQNTQRPRFDADTSDEDHVRLSKYFDLAPEMPEVKWKKKIWHLPVADAMREVEGPNGMYAEYFARSPDDPRWYEGGLYHDHEDFGVPALWLNSWYDVSIGPNLALYNHVRTNASDPRVREHQYLVVAPTLHCRFFRSSYDLKVGERKMGNANFDYEGLIYRWFDTWLKTDQPDAGAQAFARDTPKVQYYAMGANEWRSAEQWPPKKAKPLTLYLDSGGAANSLFGDGRLVRDAPPPEDKPDRFTYDPTVPVPSLGGGICCIGGTIDGGAFDQRPIEARIDILVYTSEPLEEPLEVTGPIDVTLHVASDAKDTDFTVKLIDVYPDGRAYNLDETMQRVRYREGYDREVFMQEGEVYELKVSPMSTSNVFLPGHRIRIEVSSSNFPRVARNLNTGGPNYNESEPKVARNVVHHSSQYPSRIVLSVVE
ncbi:MAG: CocE/NonD family hydrolase [Acidobacteriota bacterium]